MVLPSTSSQLRTNIYRAIVHGTADIVSKKLFIPVAYECAIVFVLAQTALKNS